VKSEVSSAFPPFVDIGPAPPLRLGDPSPAFGCARPYRKSAMEAAARLAADSTRTAHAHPADRGPRGASDRCVRAASRRQPSRTPGKASQAARASAARQRREGGRATGQTKKIVLMASRGRSCRGSCCRPTGRPRLPIYAPTRAGRVLRGE
jgi:hypothetical protein